ncbi:lasso peptide biosynthesis PqqD family chaperone [Kribbella sp. NPDC056951]|uniref:Lasso peptide biosynthesis PqqD family chaperone n=1 Tax=Kribbella yunnanensis TaxID=190194 RepID=A0ABP4SCN2_9ACTN
MTYTLAPGMSWTDTDEGMVLLNEKSGSYLTLNRTGATVLHGILDGKSPDELITTLQASYPDASERIAADVGQLMTSFQQAGVLRP